MPSLASWFPYRWGRWKWWLRPFSRDFRWFRHTSLLQSPKQRMKCHRQLHRTTAATSPPLWQKRSAHPRAARTRWTLWALAAGAPVASAVVAAGAAAWWVLCCSPTMWRFDVGRTRALGSSSCPPWAGLKQARPLVSARRSRLGFLLSGGFSS